MIDRKVVAPNNRTNGGSVPSPSPKPIANRRSYAFDASIVEHGGPGRQNSEGFGGGNRVSARGRNFPV